MKLIGFNGKMGVGKSTAIRVLEQVSDSPVFLVKFAQPLYDIQEAVYDRIRSVYIRPDDFKKDRKLLQWLGTDWGRDTISPTIWVDIWRAEVKRIAEEFENVVIVCDDVRFDNEAEVLRTLGGVVVKIERPDNTAHAEGGVGIANHASEAGIRSDLIDHTIHNSSTFEAFQASLSGLYRGLGVGQSESAA